VVTGRAGRLLDAYVSYTHTLVPVAVYSVKDERGKVRAYKAQYRDETGTRRTRIFSKRADAVQADEAAKQRRQRAKAGLAVEPSATTYREWVDTWLSGYVARPSTIASVKARLRYSVAYFGDVPLRDLRPSMIRTWVATLPVGARMKGDALKAVRQVLKAAVLERLIPENPARSEVAPIPRQMKSAVKPFHSWQEVESLCSFLGLRDAALVMFMAATGLRPGGAFALRWGDVDFEARTLRIARTLSTSGEIVEGEAKTSGSLRSVRLSKRALDALEGWRSVGSGVRPGDFIFPGHAREGTMNALAWRRDIWTPALKKAGLAHRRPYDLRHTFAVLSLSAGVDIGWIGKQMGHVSPSVTLSTYAMYLKQADDHALRLLDAAE
jgi:integrase